MITYSKDSSRIETERLILRAPSMRDISDIVENLNNLSISKWLAVVPYPYKKKDAVWYVNRCKEKLRENPRKDGGPGIECVFRICVGG